MTVFRNNSAHPGWPTAVGPLRVAAGVIRLRPVRLRDAAQWSRARLADRARRLARSLRSTFGAPGF